MNYAVMNDDTMNVYIDKYNQWLNEAWDLFTWISMCVRWTKPPVNNDYYSDFKEFDEYEVGIAVRSILPQGWWHNKKHSIQDQKKQVKYLKDLINAQIKHKARYYKNAEGHDVCGKSHKDYYSNSIKKYNKHLRVLSYIENEIDIVIAGIPCETVYNDENDENEKESLMKFLNDFMEIINEQAEN